MKISVLIVMRNEANKIGRTIRHIKKQDYPKGKYEIITIDDNSSDSSAKTAQKHGAKVISLKKNVWASEGRRIGIKHCRGKVIIFLDAHLYLTNPKNFQIIDKILSRNPSLGGVCGFYKSKNKSDWNQFRDIRREIIFNKQRKRIISLDNFTTLSIALAAIRQEVFKKINFPKGFYKSFGEDTYFQLQAHNKGWDFMFIPQITGIHDSPQNANTIKKKMVYEMRGTANILYNASRERIRVPFLHFFLSYPLTFIISLVLVWFLPLSVGLFFLALSLILEISKMSRCLKAKLYPLKIRIGAFFYSLIKEFWAILYIPLYILRKNGVSIKQFLSIGSIIIKWEIKKWQRCFSFSRKFIKKINLI